MNTLKRILAIAMALILVLVLAAFASCTKTEQESDQNPDQPDQTDVAEGGDDDLTDGLPNPIEETTAEGITEASGFVLTAPEGAENVKYAIINAEEPTYEMSFTLDGKDYCYRVTPTSSVEAADTTGVYYDWNYEGVTVANFDAKYASNDEATVLYWLDVVPGINYSLSCNANVAADDMIALAESLYVPTQGDSDGDEIDGSELAQLMAGHYEDENSNTVDVVYTGMSTYDVTISINRLSVFEGIGRFEENCVKFTVEAPDGSTITGRFFPEVEGDGFDLCFTDSQWNLLESGTTFEGFAPAAVVEE